MHEAGVAEACCGLQMLAREGKQKAIDAKQAEAKKAEQARQAQAVAAREAKAKAEADALKEKARKAQEARQQQVKHFIVLGGPHYNMTTGKVAAAVQTQFQQEWLPDPNFLWDLACQQDLPRSGNQRCLLASPKNSGWLPRGELCIPTWTLHCLCWVREDAGMGMENS